MIHREESQEGASGEASVYPVESQLGQLTGGNKTEKVLSLRTEINLTDFQEGRYGIYFSMVDPDSQKYIYLANQQNMDEYGYCLGYVELSR